MKKAQFLLGIFVTLGVVGSAHIDAAHAVDRERPALTISDKTYIPKSLREKYGLEGNGMQQQAPDQMSKDMTAQPVGPVERALQMPQEETLPAPIVELGQPKNPELIRNPQIELPQPVVNEPTSQTIIQRPSEIVMSWRARKGEELRTVLERWAARAGVDFQWESATSPRITEDVSYVGSFKEATEKLIGHSSSGALDPVFVE